MDSEAVAETGGPDEQANMEGSLGRRGCCGTLGADNVTEWPAVRERYQRRDEWRHDERG